MSAELQASRRDATLILTLSNPGTGNALHADMIAAAIETLSTAERDEDVRAVVLTGAGSDFCSGNPPARWLDNRARDGADAAQLLELLQGWIDAIRACPKPVFAAVEGSATGAGFALTLACDFLVAGNSARFSLPGIRMGLLPEGGMSWSLLRMLPRPLAAELLLEGATLDAPRLLAAGLINRVVADGTALEAALAWAESFAQRAPETVEAAKSLLQEAATNTYAEQLALEKRLFVENLHQVRARDSLSAYLTQRSRDAD